MSKISTIHDAITTKISSLLASYKQIPNPYLIEDNPITILDKGFGVAVGPGVRTDRIIACQTSWERSFTISLVNYVRTTDTNTTVRETLTKNILEDHYTLFTEFEKDAGLSGVAIDGIVSSDGGIELIEITGKPHFLVEIDLTVEYLEDLTSL